MQTLLITSRVSIIKQNRSIKLELIADLVTIAEQNS